MKETSSSDYFLPLAHLLFGLPSTGPARCLLQRYFLPSLHQMIFSRLYGIITHKIKLFKENNVLNLCIYIWSRIQRLQPWGCCADHSTPSIRKSWH
jgi:hypothetical protein